VETCITTYRPLALSYLLPESYAFQRHLFADGGAVNIAKFWFRPCIRNYVWSQLLSSGKSWFPVTVYLLAWGSSEDYCMYETSILYCSVYCHSRRICIFLFEWGILMYLFLIIKLLSLLFMCVPFLYHVSFHTHTTWVQNYLLQLRSWYKIYRHILVMFNPLKPSGYLISHHV
jgi:hypothetical protein